MPKLRGAHYSRVGHPAARLDGVSLYFTPKQDPYGEPCDSVAFLRNGGGKTSLIQLTFSGFITNKREFAGKTSDGGERSLDQYFLPGEVGIVVTEWSLGKDAPIRVIGQCVEKKAVGTTDLDRFFFSFIVGDQSGNVGVNDLPLRQFKSAVNNNPGNVTNISAFKTMMGSLFHGKPHQEYFGTHVQEEWVNKLRSWGFEPDLFRMLIQLNRNEGGSKQMAKSYFGSVDLLIGLISTLTTKDKNIETIQDLINRHREDLNELRPLKLQQEMWSALRERFQSLVAPSGELNTARKKLEEAEGQCRQVASRVLATPAVLATSITERSCEKATMVALKESNEESRKNVVRQRNWVDKRRAEIILDECKASHTRAVEAARIAVFEHRAFKGRNVALEVENLEDRCSALTSAIAEASSPAEAIHKKLNGIGGRLATIYSEEADTARRTIKKTREELEQVSQEIEQKRNALEEKISAGGTCAQKIETLGDWFKEAESSLARLTSLGAVFATDRTPQDARRRINESVQLLVEQVAEADRIIGSRTQIRTALGEQKGTCSGDISAKDQELQRHRTSLGDFLSKLREISSDEGLCLYMEQSEVDPYTLGLTQGLEEKSQRLTHDAFNLEIEQRRDREAQSFLEGDYKLMPPQEDVWAVVSALRAKDITAYPYVAYLNENRHSPEEIRAKLRQDPGRYGGVGVTNEKYLDQAREVASELPSLRGPVQISLLSREDMTPSASAASGMVALPKDNATFNAQAAAEKSRRLGDEINNRAKEFSDFANRAEELTDAKDRVNQFLGAYPPGSQGTLEEAISSSEEGLARSQSTLTEINRQIEDIDGEIAGLEETRGQAQKNLDLAKGSLSMVVNYLDTFGDKLDAKIAEKEKLIEQKKRLDREVGELKREARAAQEKSQSLNDQMTTAQTTETNIRGKLSKLVHCNTDIGILAEEDGQASREYLEEKYEKLEKNYDQETQAVDGLKGELKGKKEALDSRKRDLEKEIDGIPQTILDVTRQNYPNGVDAPTINAAAEKAHQFTLAIGRSQSEEGAAKKVLESVSTPKEGLLEPTDAANYTTTESCREGLAKYDLALGEIAEDQASVSSRLAALNDEISQLKRDMDSLKPTLKMVQTFLDGATPIPAASGYFTVLEAQESWEGADTSRQAADKAEKKAKRVVDEITDQVVGILQQEKYTGIADIARRRLLDARSSYHLDAPDFANDAKDRLDSIEHTISDLDNRQKEIVDYLMDDVRAAKANLEALTRTSRLPENNTAWAPLSGKPFFKVEVNSKKFEDGYGRNRVEDYLKSVINARANNLPNSAKEIIQGAAKFALKDITRVTTMKPDHFASTKPYTLEEAAAWSGGEGLTYAAIALMAFNNLAADIHNTLQKGGNFLLIDNPIGSCNHQGFLKLQRLMSSLLNVQLVYPTGVKDHEALSLFPNFIALSNNRRDTRTGHTYIEVDKQNGGSLPSGGLSVGHMTIERELVDDL